MKAIPCSTAGCSGFRGPGSAYGPRPVVMPDGRPHLVGAPSGFPVSVICSACRRRTTVTAASWARLPTLTPVQLEAMGELEPLTRDLVGAGLPREQARDLVGAGIFSLVTT